MAEAKTKAVAKNDVADLPDLVPTPSIFNEIGSDDVALERLKIGQDTSPPVQARSAEFGDIYTVMSKEDVDPLNMAWEYGTEGANGISTNKDKGLVFHVIDMYRGKADDSGEEFQLYDYNDENAPDTAWVTYNYFLCVPTIDDYLPVKFVMWKTARQAAQTINTILKKNQARGPAYTVAFELTAKRTKNDKGRYCIPMVKQVEPTEENVIIASKQAALLGERPDIRKANSDPANEPGI